MRARILLSRVSCHIPVMEPPSPLLCSSDLTLVTSSCSARKWCAACALSGHVQTIARLHIDSRRTEALWLLTCKSLARAPDLDTRVVEPEVLRPLTDELEKTPKQICQPPGRGGPRASEAQEFALQKPRQHRSRSNEAEDGQPGVQNCRGLWKAAASSTSTKTCVPTSNHLFV